MLFLSWFGAVMVTRVAAQKSSATCTAEWNWLNNKQSESACTVAAHLLALCDTKPSAFTLGSDRIYIPTPGSSVALIPNTCSCNIVTYNLLMACQACQKGSSPSEIPAWSDYGEACTICSTESGIAPGPCGQQPNAGFPSSVHPAKGSIGVPLWAVENTSGSKWNPSAARKIAGQGGERIIQAPVFATAADTKASDAAKGTKDPASHGNEKMKVAVIVCVCLATIIAVCLGIYLLRLWHIKRKERRMREFGDRAFDEVVPTRKRDFGIAKGNGGSSTPMKLNFKNMVARLTIALPKTPIFPKTPRTPGMAEKMPSTPLTARFWTFGKRDTKKLSIIEQEDESEYLAEKSVRFEPMPGHDLRRQKPLTKRCDSVASNYSDFDSYKSATSQNATPRPGSVASFASSRSKETLTTGSVIVDQPKLREAKRVDSVRPAASSASYEPARRGSQSRVDSQELPSSLSKSLPAARAKSQSVKVGEWNDRSSVFSQESRKSTKSVKSSKESMPRIRSAIMSEVETSLVRGITLAGDNNATAHANKRTKSTSSRSRLNSGAGSDFEGSLSDSEQRETIQFPDELRDKQRQVSERFSVTSSSDSSTMDKSTGRIQDLFKTATRNLDESKRRTIGSEETDGESEDHKRASGVTVSSDSSNLRRLDSVIGQLEFDEMMTIYGSPTKKSWFARLSTKSGKSVPPPSPAFSSAPGFAM